MAHDCLTVWTLYPRTIADDWKSELRKKNRQFPQGNLKLLGQYFNFSSEHKILCLKHDFAFDSSVIFSQKWRCICCLKTMLIPLPSTFERMLLRLQWLGDHLGKARLLVGYFHSSYTTYDTYAKVNVGSNWTKWRHLIHHIKRSSPRHVVNTRVNEAKKTIKYGVFWLVGRVCCRSWTVVRRWTKQGKIYFVSEGYRKLYSSLNKAWIQLATRDVSSFWKDDVSIKTLVLLSFQFRFVIKYRNCDGKLVLKGTDDQVVGFISK